MGNWKLLPLEKAGPLSPPARGGAASALIGDDVFILGGADRCPTVFSDSWLWNSAEFSWTKISLIADARLLPRSGASLTTVGSKLLLFGGQDPVSCVCYNDVLEIDTRTWTCNPLKVGGKGGGRPLARHSHVAGLFQQRYLVIFGGATLAGTANDVWIMDVETLQWSFPVVHGAAPRPREMHTGTMLSPTEMLVLGGRSPDDQVLNDAALLVLEGTEMRWKPLPKMPLCLCAHTATLVPQGPEEDGSAAEASASGAEPSGSGEGQEDEQKQEQKEEGKAPGLLGGFSWKPQQGNGKSQVLLYGGFNGSTVQQDLLILDPETLGVELLILGDPSVKPLPRFAHIAAAVPSSTKPECKDVFIFGGVNPAQDLNDSAVYQC